MIWLRIICIFHIYIRLALSKSLSVVLFYISNIGNSYHSKPTQKFLEMCVKRNAYSIVAVKT
jgi:hypothetical protein